MGGRGATASPREAKWSSGIAAVFWVYYNKNIFKDPFGHYYYYHYREALYYKDSSDCSPQMCSERAGDYFLEGITPIQQYRGNGDTMTIHSYCTWFIDGSCIVVLVSYTWYLEMKH